MKKKSFRYLKKGAATIDPKLKNLPVQVHRAAAVTSEIEQLVDLYQKEKPKDPQVKLDFGF
jgi:hypothetical protein